MTQRQSTPHPELSSEPASGFISLGRAVEGYNLSDTLGAYETEEISVRKAAKLLRKQAHRRRRPGVRSTAASERRRALDGISAWSFLSHQDLGCEVEEVDPDDLLTLMFGPVCGDDDSEELLP